MLVNEQDRGLWNEWVNDLLKQLLNIVRSNNMIVVAKKKEQETDAETEELKFCSIRHNQGEHFNIFKSMKHVIACLTSNMLL